jgi:hypothetical protein
MYSSISFPYPRTPSPCTEPRLKLSSHPTFACASLRTMGCPSCRTLCIVISALKVCTSSAKVGCLNCALVSCPSSVQCHLHFHASPKGSARLVVPSVDDAASNMLSLGRSLVCARSLFDVDGKLRFLLGHVHVPGRTVESHVGLSLRWANGRRRMSGLLVSGKLREL